MPMSDCEPSVSFIAKRGDIDAQGKLVWGVASVGEHVLILPANSRPSRYDGCMGTIVAIDATHAKIKLTMTRERVRVALSRLDHRIF